VKRVVDGVECRGVSVAKTRHERQLGLPVHISKNARRRAT
jgi:hypothetical protein